MTKLELEELLKRRELEIFELKQTALRPSQRLEYLKAIMPLCSVLLAAIVGYYLVDRHAQQLAVRTHELKVVKFEAQNVFRILDKYIEQPHYPELARHQMLDFISQTNHNADLKVWAEKQRAQSQATANKFLELSKDISLQTLQKTKEQFDADKKKLDSEIKFSEQQNELIQSLSEELVGLRQQQSTARAAHADILADVRVADNLRDNARKKLSNFEDKIPPQLSAAELR